MGDAGTSRNRRVWLAQVAAGTLSVVARPVLAQHDEYGEAPLRGAGSTLVEPLMQAWVRQYRADPFGVLVGGRAPDDGLSDALSSDSLDYEPVGSLAGIQRIRAGFVDFAVSEMPLGPVALEKGGLRQFPWVLGGVAIVLGAGLASADPLRLDASMLSAIYRGEITRWRDPAIAALNPGRSLPDAPIGVRYRRDGSGTTFTLARWLSAHDPAWTPRFGVDLLLRSPNGDGVRGSAGMVRSIAGDRFGIGYVNVVQARSAGLAIAALRNREQRYLLPDAESIGAAASATPFGREGPVELPIDAAGPGSYPLVATAFGFVRWPTTTARQQRTIEFLRWTLTRGAPIADRMGYRSLPATLSESVLGRLSAPG